jgi:hypothetical protein
LEENSTVADNHNKHLWLALVRRFRSLIVDFHLRLESCSVDGDLMLAPGLMLGPPLPMSLILPAIGLSQKLGGGVLLQPFPLIIDPQGPLSRF